MKLTIHRSYDGQGLIAGNLLSRLIFTLATGGIRKEIFIHALPIEAPAAEREEKTFPFFFLSFNRRAPHWVRTLFGCVTARRTLPTRLRQRHKQKR